MRSFLAGAVASLAAVTLTVSASAATIATSATAPAVDGADIAMLNQAGASTSNGKLWTDTPVLGQTFTVGSECMILDAITVQSGTLALATKTYSIRVGQVSGAVLTVLATESGTQTGTVNADDYITFTLATPVFLWADTVYGFDVAMTGSTTGWSTGIPYLKQNANTNYPDGQGYSTGAQHIPGATISLGNYDRVFHLNLTATEAPKLTLQVNTTSGATTLLGHSGQSISMNYYQVTSAGESLSPAGWVSLADQDFDGGGPPSGFGDGWEEAGGAAGDALAEAYLLGDSVITPGLSIALGAAYDKTVDARDLAFTYLTDTGRVVEGLVEYFSPLPGDTDNDGDVDNADIGKAAGSFTGAGLSSAMIWNDGDVDGDGDVDNADLGLIIGAFTGAHAGGAGVGAATVPEPGSMLLLAAGAVGLAGRVGRRNSRGL